MYPFLLFAMAAAGLAVVFLGLVAWRREGSNLVLFNALALLSVVLTLALAGAGGWLGPGQQLRDLHAFPVLIGAFALPLSLYTFAMLARRLGHAWARIDWGHGTVCLLAAALLLYSLWGVFGLKSLVPACWDGLVWYQRAVPRAFSCGPESVGGADAPWVLGAVLCAYLGLGIALWRLQRWPGLLALMVAGIALQMLPAAAGPVPGFLGLGLCFIGIGWVAARYAAVFRPPPEAPPAQS